MEERRTRSLDYHFRNKEKEKVPSPEVHTCIHIEDEKGNVSKWAVWTLEIVPIYRQSKSPPSCIAF